MMRPPVIAYEVTRNFERSLCDYTGAPFAVALNSCTAALLLSMKWCADHIVQHTTRGILGYSYTVEIPRHTYVSVPMSIKHAGGACDGAMNNGAAATN